MLLLKRILPVAVTVSIGWLVLISYLLPAPIQIGGNPFTLAELRGTLVGWGTVLAAFALLLGAVNLIFVHIRRIQRGQGAIFSLALVISAIGTFVLLVVQLVSLDQVFSAVILPAQSALGALLAIVLALAGFRALRQRRTVGMVLFVLAAILVVLTQPLSSILFGGVAGDVLTWLRTSVIDPITTGSLRGLLLGVAIGSLAVGLRILAGADKPQSD